MQIFEEEHQRKEIEKEQEEFEKKLEEIKSECEVLRDIGWQKHYIVCQKVSILELISIMKFIEYELEEDFFARSLCEKDYEDIVGLISQLKNRLIEIDSSLEEKYRILIEAHQWIEDEKELE